MESNISTTRVYKIQTRCDSLSTWNAHELSLNTTIHDCYESLFRIFWKFWMHSMEILDFSSTASEQKFWFQTKSQKFKRTTQWSKFSASMNIICNFLVLCGKFLSVVSTSSGQELWFKNFFQKLTILEKKSNLNELLHAKKLKDAFGQTD